MYKMEYLIPSIYRNFIITHHTWLMISKNIHKIMFLRNVGILPHIYCKYGQPVVELSTSTK